MRGAIVLLLAWAAATTIDEAAGGDWPMYRGDAARSAYTEEAIPNQPQLSWTFQPEAAPEPAWPTAPRMHFDQSFQPILVGDLVIFGSSADNKVYALDAQSGDVRWTSFTEGPIRFAPAAWQDRVFVASDDGRLYALALEDGELLWHHRGGPTGDWVLGNQRLVSRWPARGGPAVRDGTVYYAAGIWPSEEVFLHALDAETGEVVWSNDRTGRLEMAQPHGGTNARSGVAPQGHLAVSAEHVLVPTGRAVPAAFSRSDGELLYYHLQKNQKRGGSLAMLLEGEGRFINSGCLFDTESGQLVDRKGHGHFAAADNGLVHASGRSLTYYRWADVERVDRRGNEVKRRALQEQRLASLEREVTALIVADRDAVCGEAGRVSAIDFVAQQNVWWSHEVEGTVCGLAAADQRLIVTTDAGAVYCFDGGGTRQLASSGGRSAIENVETGSAEQAARAAAAEPDSSSLLDYGRAAEEIVRRTGIEEGYCVDLRAGTGRLALELARRTELQIYAVEADAEKVAAARRRLDKAGLSGTRVTVHHADPAEVAYPKYFANLVVSSRSLQGESEGGSTAWRKTIKRIQRPYGGKFCTGPIGEMQVQTRGPLPGAGSWTHQNAGAANTVCSMDRQVKGPLGMQWFRDVRFELPNRHGQGPAPLVHQGFLVTGGVHGLCCLDAFNGRVLWTYRIENLLRDYDGIHHDVGVGDTGGEFCMSDDSVFVTVENRCLKIDLETGQCLAEWQTPVGEDAPNRNWGYLAYRDGRLFGSVSDHDHTVSPRYRNTNLRTESVLFFALDAETGELLWQYEPEASIRNNAIAVGHERVYLIDRPIAPEDRIENPRRGGRTRPKLEPDEAPGGTLLALDVRTGKPHWRQEQDIFGTQLGVSDDHGVLLMYYQAVRHSFFKLPSEIGGRIAAISTEDGNRLWDREQDYVTRPLINDDKVYAQGGSWDLRTGEPLDFELDRSYGCGQISAGAHLMLFRSATLGYQDLTRDAGVENYGGIRPSCWINAVPASGLVLVPDGSAKCNCSYQMKAWFALRGAE